VNDVTPVFLLSLPRSGSTLLQRLLAVSPEVATATEPWFLLPLAYSTRARGTHNDYQQPTCATALEGLSASLTESSGSSWPAMAARFAGEVYDELSPPGTRYFVDKTPRYSLITPELASWFPHAKFVVLWRNPLASAASFTRTICEGTWRFWRNHVDLYDGLANLVDLVEGDDLGRVVTVRYEDLVQDPDRELTRIGNHLDLDLDPGRATREFGAFPVSERLGDRWGAARFDQVSAAPLDEWPSHYDTSVRRLWARRYLDWLGDDRLAVMGYDRADLLDQIKGQRGGRIGSDLVRALYGSLYTRLNTSILDHSAGSLLGRRPAAEPILARPVPEAVALNEVGTDVGPGGKGRLVERSAVNVGDQRAS
jgi:hypothetical protein